MASLAFFDVWYITIGYMSITVDVEAGKRLYELMHIHDKIVISTGARRKRVTNMKEPKQEQQLDAQRAEELYLLAEKKYQESPDDASLLHTMALALITRQLSQINEQMQPLHEDMVKLRETMDAVIKRLTGVTLYQHK